MDTPGSVCVAFSLVATWTAMLDASNFDYLEPRMQRDIHIKLDDARQKPHAELVFMTLYKTCLL